LAIHHERSVQVGEVISCEVTRTGQWGAYVVSERGEVGFIDFTEVTWKQSHETRKGLKPGMTVEAIFSIFWMPMRRRLEPHSFARFARSTRSLTRGKNRPTTR